MKQIDKIYLTFLGMGLLTIILGAVSIYSLMNPYVPTGRTASDTLWTCILILCFGASIGWAIHGTGFFLFKVEGSTSKTEVFNKHG